MKYFVCVCTHHLPICHTMRKYYFLLYTDVQIKNICSQDDIQTFKKKMYSLRIEERGREKIFKNKTQKSILLPTTNICNNQTKYHKNKKKCIHFVLFNKNTHTHTKHTHTYANIIWLRAAKKEMNNKMVKTKALIEQLWLQK